jgi:GNAT superfamily N-acetyltransferase
VAEVSVRDAQRGDAAVIGQVSASAVPYVVRSTARVAADLRQDAMLGRRRWVGLLGHEVCGTATARHLGERAGSRDVFLTVRVRPDRGSQGVGTALLHTAARSYPGATRLQSLANDDPISLSFAVRNGFVPEGEHHLAKVDPRGVPPVGEPPDGLRAVTLEALADLRMLLETHNLAADDDPGLVSRRMTMYQLRAEWWARPDNAPDLSWGLVGVIDPNRGPVLAAFTSVQVDAERGRCWSRTTATHPAFRGRGLAAWVKHRTLNSLAQAGLSEAWTPNDVRNGPMFALNSSLGYEDAATSVRLTRRLPHRRGSDAPAADGD